MDENEDESYPPSSYDGNSLHGYGSSSCRQKLPVRNCSYSRVISEQYNDIEEEEHSDAEDDGIELMGEDDGVNPNGNGFRYIEKDIDEDVEDDEEEFGEENEGDDGMETDGRSFTRADDEEIKRHPKKRKLKSLISTYEFAPRVPAGPLASQLGPKFSSIGRNPLTDWSERETFVLLEAWGDKFVEHGRKSLRSDEWLNVADKVSKMSKMERTDTQCRNRLDTLKKKYKKEKIKVVESRGKPSNWVYFNEMDKLMSTSSTQGAISCGMELAEFQYSNQKGQSHRIKGLDEVRESPGNSESYDAKEDDSDGLPPKKRRTGRDHSDVTSFRLLADSILKFSEIYEKTENSKRQQVMELEKMRMDFHKDLETQRRKIMEKVQADIAKIMQSEDDGMNVSIGKSSN